MSSKRTTKINLADIPIIQYTYNEQIRVKVTTKAKLLYETYKKMDRDCMVMGLAVLAHNRQYLCQGNVARWMLKLATARPDQSSATVWIKAPAQGYALLEAIHVFSGLTRSQLIVEAMIELSRHLKQEDLFKENLLKATKKDTSYKQ